MARFKHKQGGICEVFSESNIEKLKKDKNYIEITGKETRKPVNDKKAMESNTQENSDNHKER